MDESNDAPKSEEQTISDTAPGMGVQVNSISAQEPEKQNTTTDKKETYQEPHSEIAGAKKKAIVLSRVCFVLSLILALICGPGLLLAAYIFQPFSWVALLLVESLSFTAATTVIIIISLISFITSIKVIRKTDDTSFKSKISAYNLVNAISLLAPAALCSTFSIPGLSILSICILDSILVLAAIILFILEAKKKYVIKDGIVIRIITVILLTLGVVLCGSWYFTRIRYIVDPNWVEKREESERKQAIESQRNSSIEDELSDVVAASCIMNPSYKIIYHDNRTEGIFKCEGDDRLFYAAYLGKNQSGREQVSMVDLFSIGEGSHILTQTIDERGRHAIIFILDADNETSAYEQAKTQCTQLVLDSSPDGSRMYAFYAKGYNRITDKDYLNAVIALGVKDSSDYYDSSCDRLNEYNDKYECVMAKGDLFERYINNKDNYSSLSADALFKNRHIYINIPNFQDIDDNDGIIESTIKERLASGWQKPLVPGKLSFEYISPENIIPDNDIIKGENKDDNEDFGRR